MSILNLTASELIPISDLVLILPHNIGFLRIPLGGAGIGLGLYSGFCDPSSIIMLVYLSETNEISKCQKINWSIQKD